MKRTLSHDEAEKIPVEGIITILNQGVQLVGGAAPIISTLFDKLSDLFAKIGSNSPNSPKNRLKRIEILEAQNKLQKELNKVLQEEQKALSERLKALEEK